MDEVAIGINGDFSIGSDEAHKWSRWNIQSAAALVNTSGFDDDGESTFEVGVRARAWSAGGVIKLSGSGGNPLIDVGFTDTATFTISPGIVTVADVVVSEVNVGSNYMTDAPYSMGGRISGAPTSLWT